MRPVNLIPPEDRRGANAPLRTGATVYVLLGALAIALLTVTVLVLTGNGIKDREAELAALEARQEAASATAAALQPYVEFATMFSARDQTVASLAASRFDWERVLRELALVIPEDVWLSTATASGSSDAAATSTEDTAAVSTLVAGSSGPNLQLTGCAASHRAVASFVAALEDIDGVTRVGLSSDEQGSGSTTAAGGAGDSDCRTRNFISRFEIVAVFDEAPVADTAAAAAAGTAVPGTVPPATSPEAATDPETSDAVAQQQAATDSATTQTDKAKSGASAVGVSAP
jgi:Tfp pilus assembly protein PilN